MSTGLNHDTCMDRRHFIGVAGACLGGLATASLPSIAFAQVPGRKRLVFVLLRGGFDGLAAVPPTFDPHYQATRGALAAKPSDLIPLERGFALTPGLAPLAEFWKRDELAVLHAVAIPYRTRSHFDGQAVLETGLDKPKGSSDGWLNRLLTVMGGSSKGVSVAAGMPRSLMGPAPVSTWSPANLESFSNTFLDRLHVLYRADRELANPFEAALAHPDIDLGDNDKSMKGRKPDAPGSQIDGLFRAAAKLLTVEGGPNVAAMEMSGWDTHTNQGLVGGYLDRLLGRLASGLKAFRDEMGSQWPGTTVVVMTEFGRAAKPNGAQGTDHGTAGASFVIADGVAKRKVIADWPGLGEKELLEGRDLAPTLDTRAVLKGVLAGTFDLTGAQLNRVFPMSSNVRPVGRIFA